MWWMGLSSRSTACPSFSAAIASFGSKPSLKGGSAGASQRACRNVSDFVASCATEGFANKSAKANIANCHLITPTPLRHS